LEAAYAGFFCASPNLGGRREFKPVPLLLRTEHPLLFCLMSLWFSMGGSQMAWQAKLSLVVVVLIGATSAPATAAEREDVRKAINLVASVKMPYPESLSRNRAKTERVWLEREGATTGCIRIEDRRWCFEHIAPPGNRAEMLRIRNEPSRGVSIGAMYYYVADYDLDGLIDVGSTTQIEAVDRPPRTPIAHVIEFFSRSTKRGEQASFQKMYDEGIQIALKHFGE
jgi:hypothetical protein